VCYFVVLYRYYFSTQILLFLYFEFHVHITLIWTRDHLMDIIVHPVQLLLSRNSLHKYQASLRVI
jgi:hypothetical protein